MNYIDLHTHTNESDGSFTPEELIAAAKRIGLAALAITDHDTFAGYEQALPFAEAAAVPVVRGIELNSRLEVGSGKERFAHILAYFPDSQPTAAFAHWITDQQIERRSRNQRLIQSLQSKNVDITLEEVEALGRSLAGRPHFARILVNKGYATDLNDAFRRFIGENAPTFVPRQSFTAAEVVSKILDGGGVPVLAHPIRLSISDRQSEREVISALKTAGLVGIEAIHSEQSPEIQDHYTRLARDLSLAVTGGSDFHGSAKPDIELGTGRNNNVRVPASWLQDLRNASPTRS